MKNNQENNNLMMNNNNFKVALIHDFLVQCGGAERVLKELSEIFPEAPIYTLLYDKQNMKGMFRGKTIRCSYLQKFPKFIKKRYRWLLPFFMVIPETFDFRDYDLVISSSGAWTKGIVTRLNTVHISYMHSPMRFAWDHSDQYLKEIKQRKFSFFVRFALNYVRLWDRLAADRPDHIIANSKFTKQRIEKYYRRESQVIYPPLEISSAISNQLSNHELEFEAKSYFLVVSRLSPYKKVDLVVEAFNKMELPLIIIGEGEQEKYLKKIAKNNIKIIGWQNDDELRKYYANAQGFIFPSEDDFGMTVIEAMSFGVPVVAFKKGGTLETIKEGVNGEFFAAQTPEVLADGIRRFMKNKDQYDTEEIRKIAQEFSKERFRGEIEKYVERIMNKSQV